MYVRCSVTALTWADVHYKAVPSRANYSLRTFIQSARVDRQERFSNEILVRYNKYAKVEEHESLKRTIFTVNYTVKTVEMFFVL